MILDKFPCRIGIPEQKVCDTKEEALERINRHNGITDVYATLFNGTIDKCVWDFDIEPNDPTKYKKLRYALEDFRYLKEYVEDHGWEYMCVFSGNGLHFYLRTVDAKLKNPRAALRTVQESFQNELGLKTDEAIFGDKERIFRVPNTWHPGAERYCIPLKPDEIYLGPEEIYELAQEQRFDVNAVAEGEPYDIVQHDEVKSSYSPFETGEQMPGNFNPAEIEPEGTIFPIYPCIANLLKNRKSIEKKGHGLGFRRRFLVILHLKETGHTYQETVQILKKYLSSEEFYHCIRGEKQVQQIYKRDDMVFPDCESLMTEIPCIHDPPQDPCESKDSLYY